MSKIVFDSRADQPDEQSLADVLGDAWPCWEQLDRFLHEHSAGLQVEWKFYGKKHGWQLKAIKQKRSVLYMIPDEGSFRAGLALNGPALDELQQSGLPPALIEEVMEAKAYPEGKPARVVVTSSEEVQIVEQLVQLKLASLN